MGGRRGGARSESSESDGGARAPRLATRDDGAMAAERSAPPSGVADDGLSGQRTRSKYGPARPEGYQQRDESRGEAFGG